MADILNVPSLPGAAKQVDSQWSPEEMAWLKLSQDFGSIECRRRQEAEAQAKKILGPEAVAWYGPTHPIYGTRWHCVAASLKQIYKGTTWRDALRAAEEAVRG